MYKLIEKSTVQLASISTVLTNGSTRSIRVKKNILTSLLLKGISVVVSLLLVPLTIHYVSASQYGIWLTLSSVVAWISFFDVGLTHGLRNKFASAKASGNEELAQVYVSTTFFLLAGIFTFLWLCFMVVNPFLNWAAILQLPANRSAEVTALAAVIFTYFCLQFVLRIITTVITANQQPAQASVIDVLGQVISLMIVAILVKTTQGSLLKLGLALCISPVVVVLGANFFFFRGAYKKYCPSIKKVRLSHAKQLFNLGVMFFIIQLAAIIQFQTANIIIARNFGTTEVTSYNIVYKYFGLLNMLFTIFITPFWSASTEAFCKKDFIWIKNGIRRYGQLTLLLLAIGCFMLIFSNTFYRLWLGSNTVSIDFALSCWGLLFFSVSMYGGKYVSFLNGISALRLQFYTSLASPLVYIVVANLLIKSYNVGVQAVFIASVVANFYSFFLAPLQYHMIVSKGKGGIWIK